MAWRLLAVLLVLTGTAWPAPIVVTCYDGSSSASVRWLPTPRTVRLSVCDEDRHLDGQCQFPRTLHHGRGLRDLPAGMSALRTWRLRRVSHDQPGRLHLDRHLPDPTLGARPKTSWVADTDASVWRSRHAPSPCRGRRGGRPRRRAPAACRTARRAPRPTCSSPSGRERTL